MRYQFSWRLRGNEHKYLKEVLRLGFKAGADGAFTSRLERKFADLYNQEFGIAFNSGTSTLHSILVALGIKSGDEVIVPSLTPLMCGLAIHYTGATPIYVDVDPDTFLMDPEEVDKKISERTRAIMVVHMYGGVCDMTKMTEISKRTSVPIIEDCAQCHGGRANNGLLAGTSGIAGSWSFENSKQLTCGDGGIVTTSDSNLAERIRKVGGLGFKTLTSAGGRVRTDRDKLQNPNWERFDTIGFNYRMNQLAAAVALAQVEKQETYISLREKSGEIYREAINGSSLLSPQRVIPASTNTYYTFSAKFRGTELGVSWEQFREKYISFGGDGIYAASKLLYQEPIFRNLKIGRGVTPVAEKLQGELMNFTTNQSSVKEMRKQGGILQKTRRFFGD